MKTYQRNSVTLRPEPNKSLRAIIGDSRQEEIAEAAEVMRDIILLPLGRVPKRDRRIRAAWRSSE